MKKLDIIVFGNTMQDFIDALEHAIDMLRLGTPSESISWGNGTHVTFDVVENVDPRIYEAYVGDSGGGTE